MIRIVILAAAALSGRPVAHSADAAPTCVVARPAASDLKAHAATFFAKASLADLDALATCLGDPDPAVRDDFAFTLWSEGLRGRHLTVAQMRHALARLTATTVGPDDGRGFRRPFAALALSEVARADRVEPFLSAVELHDLVATGATYLRGVTDYRGFIAGEGWRHGVAHGADLAMQLALNPRLARADADVLLGAIAAQVAPPGSHAYVHGEARRLARPLLFLAKRPDIDDAAWAAWFQTLHPNDAPRWKAPYASAAGLAAVHNSSAFGDAVYVAASESQDPQVRRLAPLAAGLLKALP
ncbi:DUF2785 domain-containing protein [Sphingopyxis sp. RIFCSPHIGHO2_12_FULL_65_19]|uniref:DUF2785 domain-containing protein n=1 Tax=Sphingopyxis sp. RIFCSPHIGHO2_12_FULL_65_19 TaxID=1802172 RepID=UPI0008CE2AC4|nr:DUF2785 domain-containing protein [Sphingopyxis sp. RIFCSPHIGHO2_12_FULL_65_19]OHD08443.1 MAG: hypothetical protein A3E77_10140 [Sphingopyxis sp. RIFCSPHIGHO2_12_FULL_65_19]